MQANLPVYLVYHKQFLRQLCLCQIRSRSSRNQIRINQYFCHPLGLQFKPRPSAWTIVDIDLQDNLISNSASCNYLNESARVPTRE